MENVNFEKSRKSAFKILALLERDFQNLTPEAMMALEITVSSLISTIPEENRKSAVEFFGKNVEKLLTKK